MRTMRMMWGLKSTISSMKSIICGLFWAVIVWNPSILVCFGLNVVCFDRKDVDFVLKSLDFVLKILDFVQDDEDDEDDHKGAFFCCFYTVLYCFCAVLYCFCAVLYCFLLFVYCSVLFWCCFPAENDGSRRRWRSYRLQGGCERSGAWPLQSGKMMNFTVIMLNFVLANVGFYSTNVRFCIGFCRTSSTRRLARSNGWPGKDCCRRGSLWRWKVLKEDDFSVKNRWFSMIFYEKPMIF